MQHTLHVTVEFGQILDEAALTAEELAHACGVAPHWVQARVDAGLLQAGQAPGGWRFGSAALLRARRIAQLEAIFDADPELAALATDLIEEVTALRRQVQALRTAEPQA